MYSLERETEIKLPMILQLIKVKEIGEVSASPGEVEGLWELPVKGR